LLRLRGSSIMRGVQGSIKRRLRLLLLLLSPSPLTHDSVSEGATLKLPLHFICTVQDPLPPLAT
jgi:hypothetical protein